ncbi:MAG: DUF3575 domain-containing protein [Cytophagales bacterium]|nr:DUF3575 domain-containing protein [Cytophagales bacterium]MDW8384699.1 DUF3575 domain-containing protein [Flammeovirgaceae bacterium]
MRKCIFVVAHSLLLFLTSCLTIFSGTKQTVFLNSEPQDASVLVNGMYVGTTPCKVRIKRRVQMSPYNRRNQQHYHFQKEGYEDLHIYDEAQINPMAIIATVFTNGISAIDFLTGASNQYKKRWYVKLVPTSEQVSYNKERTTESFFKKNVRPPFVRYSADSVRGRNIVSFYPFGLVAGTALIGWEQKVAPRTSLKTLLGYGYNDYVRYYDLRNVTEIYLELQPRFHLSDKFMFQTIYFSPFLLGKYIDGKKQINQANGINNSGSLVVENFRHTNWAVGVGTVVGYQFTFFQRLNLDFYIGGGLIKQQQIRDDFSFIKGLNPYKSGNFLHMGLNVGIVLGKNTPELLEE